SFAETIDPYVSAASAVILSHHGSVTYGATIEDALCWTEVLEAHCQMLLLAMPLGGATPLSAEHQQTIHDMRMKR
ncbi:MAG: class II aldolase/adducin family protein, partial [Planctomycetota bacterium]